MSYWRLFYHIVWATKGREPLIGAREERLLRQSFDVTLTDMAVTRHAVGMMPDHVHVAVSVPPKVALSELVQRLKGASTHAVNEATGTGFGWQREYGILSFGEKHLADVIAYVMNQRARHAADDLWPKMERVGEGRSASPGTEVPG